MEIKPDTTAPVAFLRKWSPVGPWVLTAIIPEGGKTFTMTFDEKTTSNVLSSNGKFTPS